jgi:hypothetical protein
MVVAALERTGATAVPEVKGFEEVIRSKEVPEGI